MQLETCAGRSSPPWLHNSYASERLSADCILCINLVYGNRQLISHKRDIKTMVVI